MNEINVELPDNFVKSKEMTEFFNELDAIRTNALLRIKLGKNEGDMKRRAEKETEILINLGRIGNHACPPGQIWDDALDKCVKI